MRKVLVAICLAALAGAAPAAPAAAGDGAFFDPAAAPGGRAADPHAVRQRFVTVNPDLLLSGRVNGGPVELNLFDDTVLSATPADLQRRGPGDFTWVGRVGQGGLAVITASDGRVVGRISDPARGTFTIVPAGGRVHALAEVDPASYPVEVDRPAGPGSWARAAGPDRPGARVVAAGDVVVSVLVAYTAGAAGDMGGPAAVESLVRNAMAETNQAYLDSGVIHRLELAGTREIAYQESDHSITNLDRLTRPDDGYLDAVHQWRDETGADLVILVTTPMSNACGSAWIMLEADPAFSQLAFAVVSYDCALANLSFTHEAGHLFGAQHEPAEAGPAIFRHAYAYVDCVHGFRTVMAYGTECAQYPVRVARFSSPLYPYAGFPAGDELRDNARTLNRTAAVVAAFRTPAATCAGRPVTIQGTDGADQIRGTPGADVINGLGGDDLIHGLGGNDVICGGEGNDTIYPGGGRAEAYGEAGNDRIAAGAGLNGIVDGGTGRDVIDFSEVTAAPVLGDLATGQFNAGTGACTVRRVEQVVGSALDDVIRGDGRPNVIWGGPGADRLYGGDGADVLRGGLGDDLLGGGRGPDLLRGGPGDDLLAGQGQADRLYGDAGADDLRGGAGLDLLYGDRWDVNLDGGPGEDLCSLSSGAPAPC